MFTSGFRFVFGKRISNTCPPLKGQREFDQVRGLNTEPAGKNMVAIGRFDVSFSSLKAGLALGMYLAHFSL